MNKVQALEKAREMVEEWGKEGPIVSEIAALIYLTHANAMREEREACAKLADQWSEYSGGESVKQKQLSNRLGNDPFGHGEQADFASEDLKLVAQELSCFAQAIRQREEPSNG